MSCVPCPPCDDSVLSTIASIAGILTFMYAIIVGILFYYESFKDSAREIETLLKSIRESAIEIISTDLDFDAAADLRSTTAGPRLTRDYDEAVKAETRQLDHLSLLANRFSKGYNNFQRLRHRGKYIIDKKNLTKQRAEVDKAFEKKKAAAIKSVMLPHRNKKRGFRSH